jgi:cardiolipin synthase
MLSFAIPISVCLIVMLADIIFIFTIILTERREPEKVALWILLIVVLPLVGFVLYLFLNGKLLVNRNKNGIRLKNQIDIAIRQKVEDQLDKLENNEVIFSDQNAKRFEQLVRMNMYFGKGIYTHNNTVAVFTDGEQKFNSLFYDISRAKISINIMYFIIKNDELGKNLVSQLASKAREGVKVRLMYDDIGSIRINKEFFKELIEAGGKIHRFKPTFYKLDINLNYRNHRKVVVIDGQIGYLGGMNVGNEYCGLDDRVTPWRDTHLRITGPAVIMIQQRFIADWYFYSDETVAMLDKKTMSVYFPSPNPQLLKMAKSVEVPILSNIDMQIVSSGPDTIHEEIKNAIVKMIMSARESIFIQTPYFVPDSVVMGALRIAAFSGVKISIMLPGVHDKFYVWHASNSFIGELLSIGINVYFYRGFIHSKMVVVDDTVTTIGTANMDNRSFRTHFEVNAFTFSSPFALTCRTLFEKDMIHSDQIVKAWWENRSIFTRFLQRFFRLWAPFL